MIRRFPVRLSTILITPVLFAMVFTAARIVASPAAASAAEAAADEIDNPTVLSYLGGLPEPKAVTLPWRPGRFTRFQDGSEEEDGRMARSGNLAGQLYRSPQQGPAPFAVLLAGCGGTYGGVNGLWLKLWARTLQDIGVGTLALDSLDVRGVTDGVCGDGSKVWAQRRVDDAYSALAWLANQPFADPRRIFVIGMSNGARTALLSVSASENGRFHRFAAAVALYPTCDRMPPHDLLAPALLLLGQADNPAVQPVCEAYVGQRRDSAAPPRLIVYPDAFHLFDAYPRDDDYSAPEVLDAREAVKTFLRQAAGLGGPSQRTAAPAR
jgi:dienelactone hydrolase